jgi:hypothetical protein
MSVTISTTVDIDAPKQLVWKVLTNFAAYHEWNPYMKIEGTAEVGTSAALKSIPRKYLPSAVGAIDEVISDLPKDKQPSPPPLPISLMLALSWRRKWSTLGESTRHLIRAWPTKRSRRSRSLSTVDRRCRARPGAARSRSTPNGSLERGETEQRPRV